MSLLVKNIGMLVGIDESHRLKVEGKAMSEIETLESAWLLTDGGVELSPTLITCFYAFCTGELWMLASIKKSKLKSGQKGTEYQVSEFKIVRNEDDDEPVG